MLECVQAPGGEVDLVVAGMCALLSSQAPHVFSGQRWNRRGYARGSLRVVVGAELAEQLHSALVPAYTLVTVATVPGTHKFYGCTGVIVRLDRAC